MLLGWLVRLIVAAAAARGVVVLFTYAPGSSEDATNALKLEEYKLWLALIAALTAVGVAVVPAIWTLYNRLMRLHQKVEQASQPPPAQLRGWLWLGYGLLVLAAAWAQYNGARTGPLANWPMRVTVLVVLGMLIAAPAVVGTWLVAVIVKQLPDVIAGFGQPQHDGGLNWGPTQATLVEVLRLLPTLLQRLLTVLSAAVTAITLSTGALRLAVVSLPSKPSWPPAEPLLYGGLFAVLLALSYLPGAVGLQEARREFAGAVSPIPSGDLSKNWHEQRERVDTLLKVEDSSKEGVQATVAILAPLLASLTAFLLPGPD